jgi:hypothetical protein
MILKKKIKSRIRGWFPQEPTFNVIKSEAPQEPNALLALPVPTLSAIMIVASLLSAVFGAVLIRIYLILNTGTGSPVYFFGLQIGILSLAAFAVGFSSGIMLLIGKHTAAITGVVTVLAIGLATLIIPIIEAESSTIGLLFASPMIISSFAALSVTCYAMSKPTPRTLQPSVRERVFVGLTASGGGLTAIGALFYLAPLNPKEEVAMVTLVIGIPLLLAALYVRLTTEKEEGQQV